MDHHFLSKSVNPSWTKCLTWSKNSGMQLPHIGRKLQFRNTGWLPAKPVLLGIALFGARDLRREKDLDEKSQQKNLELITTWSFSMILQKTPRWEDNYVALRGLLLFQPWKILVVMNAEWHCTSTARPITALWGFEWHVHQHWMEMDCMPSRVSMFTLTRTWHISSPSQHLCCIWKWVWMCCFAWRALTFE